MPHAWGIVTQCSAMRIDVVAVTGLPPELSIAGQPVEIHDSGDTPGYWFEIDDALLGGGALNSVSADAPITGDGSSGDHLAIALSDISGLEVVDGELQLHINSSCLVSDMNGLAVHPNPDGGIECGLDGIAIAIDPAGVASLSASGLLVPASSGGGIVSIDNPESFAATFGPDLGYDQEFARTTSPTALPAGWAAINGNSGDYLEQHGKGIWTMASGFNSVSNVSFIGRDVPVEDTFTATCKVGNKSYVGVAPSMSVGLILTDGTIGYGIFWNSNPLVLTAIWSDIASTYGSNPGTADIPHAEAGIPYWRLLVEAADYGDCTFQFSYDGTFWITPVGGDHLDVGGVLTPTKIGFVIRQAPDLQVGVFDWLRIR